MFSPVSILKQSNLLLVLLNTPWISCCIQNNYKEKNTNGYIKIWLLTSVITYNYLQNCKWMVMEIYRAAERHGIYPSVLPTLKWIITSLYAIEKPKKFKNKFISFNVTKNCWEFDSWWIIFFSLVALRWIVLADNFQKKPLSACEKHYSPVSYVLIITNSWIKATTFFLAQRFQCLAFVISVKRL